VVGEAYDDRGNHRNICRRRDELLLKYLGAAYIEECMLVARRAQPNGVLLYYDYNCHLLYTNNNQSKNAKINRVLSMCRDFIARDIPIDGVTILYIISCPIVDCVVNTTLCYRCSTSVSYRCCSSP
jgi:GH35 family endo-1,4-beta-xylanase